MLKKKLLRKDIFNLSDVKNMKKLKEIQERKLRELDRQIVGFYINVEENNDISFKNLEKQISLLKSDLTLEHSNMNKFQCCDSD